MAYFPNNPNGQTIKANSSPVTIASDQTTSIADTMGGVGLGIAMMATNFIVSSNNSTAIQLAAGATFSGVIETIFNQQAISILLTSNQNGVLTLKQYIDQAGTKIVSSWAIPLTASVPFSRCFVGNGNYFSLSYQNTGASTTVGFEINTAYGTLPAATNLGNAPVSINEINGVAINPNIGLTVSSPLPIFKGRASSFRTVGRAGTTGQNLMSIHNATGSAVSLVLKKVFVDVYQTVVKAVTVAPPIIRMWKVAVLPTNGTVLTKTKIGGTSTSNASVDVRGDASADGTNSATTLTATLPAGTFISQEYAPRLITAAGYEMADRLEFFGDTEINLGALEGIVVRLDYTLATQNPITDMWIVGIEWEERTP